MKQKNKLRSVTSFLAICTSVVCACVCVLLLSGDYHMAQFKMDTYNRELEGWEACRRTNLDYYKANEKAVNSCILSVEEAKDNFWVGLSKPKLAGIFVLGTLLSASVGYLAAWFVLWFLGFGIFKFIRFFAFYRKFCSSKEMQHKYNMHSFATKS
jgi:uncharacterized membrane protein YjdF